MLTESLSSLYSTATFPVSPSWMPNGSLIDRLFSEETLQIVDQLANRLPYGSQIEVYLDHLHLSLYSTIREVQLELPHFSDWSALQADLSERAVAMVQRAPGCTAEMGRAVQSQVAESVSACQIFQPILRVQEGDITSQFAVLEQWAGLLESEVGPQLGEMAVERFLYGTPFPLPPAEAVSLWFKSGELFMKAIFDQSFVKWIRDLPHLSHELNCWARCDPLWGWIQDGVDATGDSGLFSDPVCWNQVRCAIDLPEWRHWIDFLEIAIQRHPHWFLP